MLHRPRRPREEPYPQFLFERGDDARRRRLREAQFAARAREAPPFARRGRTGLAQSGFRSRWKESLAWRVLVPTASGVREFVSRDPMQNGSHFRRIFRPNLFLEHRLGALPQRPGLGQYLPSRRLSRNQDPKRNFPKEEPC